MLIQQLRLNQLNIQGYHSRAILVIVCIRKELTTLIHKHVPNITFRLIFVNTNTIRSVFKYKDGLPDSLFSVYGCNCPSCKAGYVGSRSQNIKLCTNVSAQGNLIIQNWQTNFKPQFLSNQKPFMGLRSCNLQKKEKIKILYKTRILSE